MTNHPMARAVWFTAPCTVELREERIPEVGPADVRVRTVASAISPGTEMLVYRGQVPAGLELDLPTLRGRYSFPVKYGYASVGRVAETGRDVTQVREGDLVFVHHPHQDEYVVPEAMPVRLPPGVGADAAVFLANIETAVNVLLDAAPRLGERVLIVGQGVVGLLLTQLARRAGAGLIVAVDPLAERRRAAVESGADVALAPGDGLVDEVRRLTDGQGADLALEASGNPSALQSALDAVAFQGTVVVCSWYGVKPAVLDLGAAFHRRRLRIVSSQVSTIDPMLAGRWSRERRLALAASLVPSLLLAPLVRPRIQFERAAEAYRLLDERPGEALQPVLTY